MKLSTLNLHSHQPCLGVPVSPYFHQNVSTFFFSWWGPGKGNIIFALICISMGMLSSLSFVHFLISRLNLKGSLDSLHLIYKNEWKENKYLKSWARKQQGELLGRQESEKSQQELILSTQLPFPRILLESIFWHQLSSSHHGWTVLCPSAPASS